MSDLISRSSLIEVIKGFTNISRNYSYGILIGQKKLKEAEEFLRKNTVEGYYTLKSIYTLIKRKKIKMPIINLIYQIIINQKEPNTLVDFLIKK